MVHPPGRIAIAPAFHPFPAALLQAQGMAVQDLFFLDKQNFGSRVSLASPACVGGWEDLRDLCMECYTTCALCLDSTVTMMRYH